MLEIIEDVLPISGAEWEVVETQHYAYYSNAERTADQLRKKFNKLARTAIPTGSPNIPPIIANANRIRGLIIEKTEGGTGSVSEGFGLALGPDDQEDELDDEVSSINQGDDAALGAMVRTEQMQKTVHKMQLKRAHLQMVVLQPVLLPESFKPCLVRDQAVEDLLHQLLDQ